MEREPSALDFGERIESLRNEVELMWNDIKVSFDKIDREIDRTITRYKPSKYDTTSILYEYDHMKPQSREAYNHIVYPSVSSASSTSSNRHHHHTLSPIQQEFNKNMQPSPAPPRQTSYSTPVQSHIMTNKYFENRLRHYDSNRSEATDDGIDDKVDISFSNKHFSDLNIAGNPININIGTDDDDDDDEPPIINDTAHRTELINRISSDLERNSHLFSHKNTHHQRNNTQKDISHHKHRQSHEIDTIKLTHSDDSNNDESGHSMEYLFRDNHTDSSFDDEIDSDDGLIVLSDTKRASLSAPRGLSNIDITAGLAEEEEDKEEGNSVKYPGALPTIPQLESVDHVVDTNQNTSDITSKHEKQKSISEMIIQDLELDRTFNTKRKKKVTPLIVGAEEKEPLTPLALMTQIDIDINGNLSSITATSVPSPPILNGGLTRNSRKFTPKIIGSSDYIDIFNEDQEMKTEFEFNKLMGSRHSINGITDINYANNHHLAFGINRADSDYKPMINKDIDAIIEETKLYSPQNNKLHNISYSFDDINMISINEENVEYDNMEFIKIEETLLIIKEDGISFINEICDILANDDQFYINEFKEIQREEYQNIYSFLDKHNIYSSELKSVTLLLNQLCLKERFAIIPLYRSNAISYLYECCTRYQSLFLLDDEVSVVHIDNNDDDVLLHHLKKPTDELQVLDNVHFDDYNEYPSDDDAKKEINETLRTRELFKIENVYCPQNIAEYKVIKQVLWPNTLYNDDDDEDNEYMESIAIIKPNALKHYQSIIRATLIGNGFIISQCKAIKYSDELNPIMKCMDSKMHYNNDENIQSKEIEYLSSGIIGFMIIKKQIGTDSDCINAKQCFNKLSQLIGFVDPKMDRQNDENTQSIRGCFGEDIIHNAIDVTLTKRDFKSIYSIIF